MIERHITFNVHPDRVAEFERFFTAEYAPAMATSPGFVSVGLLREADHPSRYQMVLRFHDGGSAAAWRISPEHAALQPALTALYSDNEIQAYEVVA
jgi:antibiotic biosynthesis monooxygenase (ABM) superfamily enzyme